MLSLLNFLIYEYYIKQMRICQARNPRPLNFYRTMEEYMDTTFTDVGLRISKRIRELGLKQLDVCNKSGLSTTALSQYLSLIHI